MKKRSRIYFQKRKFNTNVATLKKVLSNQQLFDLNKNMKRFFWDELFGTEQVFIKLEKGDYGMRQVNS